MSWPQEVPRRILLTPSLRAGSRVGQRPRVFGWERRSERAQDETNISDVPAGSDPRGMKARDKSPYQPGGERRRELRGGDGSSHPFRLRPRRSAFLICSDTGIPVQGQRSYPEAPVLLGSTKTHCCVTSPAEGRSRRSVSPPLGPDHTPAASPGPRT